MNVSGGGCRLAPSLTSAALQISSPAGKLAGAACLHPSARRKQSSGDHGSSSRVWSHLETGRGDAATTRYTGTLSLASSWQICACLQRPVFLINSIINLTFFKKLILFIYFWLSWVFVAARGLSLVVASRGYSSLWCAGFSLRWLLLLWSTGSRYMGFSSCSTWAQ